LRGSNVVTVPSVVVVLSAVVVVGFVVVVCLVLAGLLVCPNASGAISAQMTVKRVRFISSVPSLLNIPCTKHRGWRSFWTASFEGCAQAVKLFMLQREIDPLRGGTEQLTCDAND
jgi:hypothetical protein